MPSRLSGLSVIPTHDVTYGLNGAEAFARVSYYAQVLSLLMASTFDTAKAHEVKAALDLAFSELAKESHGSD